MSEYGIVQQHLTTIEMDGKPCDVSVRIAYDGAALYIGVVCHDTPPSPLFHAPPRGRIPAM